MRTALELITTPLIQMTYLDILVMMATILIGTVGIYAIYKLIKFVIRKLKRK